jgi:hypothetical protein
VVQTESATNGSFTAITVAGADDVWAGGSYTAKGSASPIVVHLAGGKFTQVAIPPGLIGSVTVMGSSSASNVWAFVTDAKTGQETALRWDGQKWTKTAQWGNSKKLAGAHAVVLGKGNVWVFSEESNAIWHYDGKAWTRTNPPGVTGFASAAADPNGGLWAIGEREQKKTDVPVSFHNTGASWQPVEFTLPSSKGVQKEFNYIYAQSAMDVWAVGDERSTSAAGHVSLAAIAEQFNGAKWTAVPVPGYLQLTGAVSDGGTGLWLTAALVSGSADSNLIHYTPGSVIKPGTVAGMAVFGANARASVTSIATSPGSAQIWAVAAVTGRNGTGSVIIKWSP